MKLLYFCELTNSHVCTSNCQSLTFQSQFSMTKIILFSLKISFDFYWYLMLTLNLELLYFVKWCPIFASPTLCQLTNLLIIKQSQVFSPQVRNYTTHLTLDTYSAEEMVDIECFNCLWLCRWSRWLCCLSKLPVLFLLKMAMVPSPLPPPPVVEGDGDGGVGLLAFSPSKPSLMGRRPLLLLA